MIPEEYEGIIAGFDVALNDQVRCKRCTLRVDISVTDRHTAWHNASGV